MKSKSSGISLLISLGISFLVLGVAMGIISSIARSVEQNATLERSNQIFFAAESGMEAAFFHHNARGAGTHFVNDDVSQNISHPNSAAEVKWDIEGRATPLIGLLHEGQNFQIPFFWDAAANPAEPQSITGFDDDFVLEFYNEITSNEADGSPEEAIYEKYGAFDFVGFDFGNVDTEPLLSWSVSRENNPNGYQTFVPEEGVDVCDAASEFVCDNDLPATIQSIEYPAGTIFPGKFASTLFDFWNDGSSEKYRLSFQALLPFRDTNGTPDNLDDDAKIPGIPFAITSNDIDIPKPSYSVRAEVSVGDFSKVISVEVPERTTLGAFDYVIFE